MVGKVGGGGRRQRMNERYYVCWLWVSRVYERVRVCACVAESELLEETLTASHASGRQASLIFTAQAENTPLHSSARCRHRRKMRRRRFFFPTHPPERRLHRRREYQYTGMQSTHCCGTFLRHLTSTTVRATCFQRYSSRNCVLQQINQHAVFMHN